MEVARTDENDQFSDLQESSDQSSPDLVEKKLRRYDSLDVESRTVPGAGGHGHKAVAEASCGVILHLAFQSLGIVYGDIGTPQLYVNAILSAVGGIKNATSTMTQGTKIGHLKVRRLKWNKVQNKIVWISAAILVGIFMMQRFGTHKVGYSFASVNCIWFGLIGGIGFYNFVKFDHVVIKAVNPKYLFDYFKRNKKDAWISLGGVVLAITGTEAVFADVGHFIVKSIRLSMCCVAYLALVSDIFYSSIKHEVNQEMLNYYFGPRTVDFVPF